MDFTLTKYTELLQMLIEHRYRFLTFEYYCANKSELSTEPFVILRHDVDLKAGNALATAKIENEMGINASYYFRVVPQSNRPEIIEAIAHLGHEIGYHYEDMTISEGDVEKALVHFEKQLAYFRRYYPVKTICMHGSPRSKWDGRDLWKKYDYRDFGIIGEPYFDVDFSKLFYLTDTGRRWDGFKVSVRDKIPGFQEEWIKRGWFYHTTDDVLKAIEENALPTCLMITTHPQRWTDHKMEWLKELVIQNTKNLVKRILIVNNHGELS